MTDPNIQIDARLAILLEYLEDHDETVDDHKEDLTYGIPDVIINQGNYD